MMTTCCRNETLAWLNYILINHTFLFYLFSSLLMPSPLSLLRLPPILLIPLLIPLLMTYLIHLLIALLSALLNALLIVLLIIFLIVLLNALLIGILYNLLRAHFPGKRHLSINEIIIKYFIIILILLVLHLN